MSDAIALVRPKSRDKLLPLLDLDDESEESEGIYAEALDDGAFLLHTFQAFELFAEHPAEAKWWLLEHFGEELPELQDDPRGILFFDDDRAPDAATYDDFVSAIEGAGDGVWVSTELDDEEDETGETDAQALATLAELLGHAPEGGALPTSSFEFGRIVEGVQRQLMESLGVDPALFGREASGGAEREAVDGEADRDDEKSTMDHEPEPERPKKT